MKRAFLILTALLAVMIPTVFLPSASAQVAAVPQLLNFQGRLAKPDGTPVADGSYSIRFSLWSAVSGGVERWNQIISPITVRNGTFAVLLSGFPAGIFNNDLWLEIKVGSDAALSPRQQLVTVAYAFKADKVKDGAITTSSLADGSVTGVKLAPGALSPLAWLLGGNSGTNPASNFLGTTDNQALEVRANGLRVLRVEPAKTTTDAIGNDWFAPNLLAGFNGNTITPGAVGATLAGGGLRRILNRVTTLFPNRVTDSGGTVGGGAQNQAGDNAGTVSDAMFAVVSGGWLNTASGGSSFVGGGFSNAASGSSTVVAGGQINHATGNNAAIGGGQNNTVNGVSGAIAGGSQNTVSDNQAVIGGGFHNTNNGYAGTISGGQENVIGATLWATIAGGAVNAANGNYAMVAGGYSNSAQADYSFAAGRQAKALHPGAFVWADNSTSTDFASTGNNQFLIRAKGGVGINTTAPTAPLEVEGDGSLSGSVVLHSPKGPNFSHIHYGFWGDWYIRSASSDGNVILQDTGSNAWVGVGITPSYKMDVNGTLRVTGFINTSDARYKTHIAPLDDALEAVLNLRGVTFDWNREKWPGMNFSEGRQIGFIAQEVEKVLPELVSTDKSGYKSVAYANVVPVLVEAMKQQQKQLTVQRDQIEALGRENLLLRAKSGEIDTLKVRLSAIEAMLATLKTHSK